MCLPLLLVLEVSQDAGLERRLEAMYVCWLILRVNMHILF